MSQFANAHDRVLRGITKSSGLTIGDWFKVLEQQGIAKSGFLAGLEFLRDDRKLSHDAATALAWAFMNPEVVPDDLAKSLPGGGQKQVELTSSEFESVAAEALVTTTTSSQRPISRVAARKPLPAASSLKKASASKAPKRANPARVPAGRKVKSNRAAAKKTGKKAPARKNSKRR